jgi:hypothetical protein
LDPGNPARFPSGEAQVFGRSDRATAIVAANNFKETAALQAIQEIGFHLTV